MSSVVVDTDVVSYLFKGDTRALAYDGYLAGRLLVVSFMTVAELDLWVLERRWGAARKARLDRHLRRFVNYPVDRDLCAAWATVMHHTRQKGRPMQSADAWVAATAFILQVPLVTNNPADYRSMDGLTVLSAVKE